MDKKKLVTYTEWVLNYKRAALTTPKTMVKDFSKQNPNFFDDPDPVKETVVGSNQSQTGNYTFEYAIKSK